MGTNLSQNNRLVIILVLALVAVSSVLAVTAILVVVHFSNNKNNSTGADTFAATTENSKSSNENSKPKPPPVSGRDKPSSLGSRPGNVSHSQPPSGKKVASKRNVDQFLRDVKTGVIDEKRHGFELILALQEKDFDFVHDYITRVPSPDAKLAANRETTKSLIETACSARDPISVDYFLQFPLAYQLFADNSVLIGPHISRSISENNGEMFRVLARNRPPFQFLNENDLVRIEKVPDFADSLVQLVLEDRSSRRVANADSIFLSPKFVEQLLKLSKGNSANSSEWISLVESCSEKMRISLLVLAVDNSDQRIAQACLKNGFPNLQHTDLTHVNAMTGKRRRILSEVEAKWPELVSRRLTVTNVDDLLCWWDDDILNCEYIRYENELKKWIPHRYALAHTHRKAFSELSAFEFALKKKFWLAPWLVNAKEESTNTMFQVYRAVEQKRSDKLSELMQKANKDFKHMDVTAKFYSAMIAAEYGSTNDLSIMEKAGAKLWHDDSTMPEPIVVAAMKNNAEMVTYLIDHGALSDKLRIKQFIRSGGPLLKKLVSEQPAVRKPIAPFLSTVFVAFQQDKEFIYARQTLDLMIEVDRQIVEESGSYDTRLDLRSFVALGDASPNLSVEAFVTSSIGDPVSINRLLSIGFSYQPEDIILAIRQNQYESLKLMIRSPGLREMKEEAIDRVLTTASQVADSQTWSLIDSTHWSARLSQEKKNRIFSNRPSEHNPK